ncbi:MAG TPA: zinc-dependent metalloprotease [Acidimicrobiia bacterium]|nr:zinc-dependent metalloprotease [Acidimicrobiia bacterium]
MSEDLFSQLFELFNQPGPINWRLAREVADHLTGDPEPIDPWLADEYQQLTRLAQLQISEATPLEVRSALSGSPVDRATWARENLQSFRYLVEPIGTKLDATTGTGPLDAILKPLGPALLGMQMGVMVGFLSHRVLGQFDIGLPTSEVEDIYYVVPNVEAFAVDHGLEPQQVRLWVALHEVTHQAEFSVPWVRQHFFDLVEFYIGSIEVDVSGITDRLQQMQDPSQLEKMMEDPTGLGGLLAPDVNTEGLEAIQAFMAILEGYGDHVMDRAGAKLLPDLGRMREAMDRRRSEPTQGEQVLSRILGLELKQEQYSLGTSFCAEVSRRWSAEALHRVWDSPENLPTFAELEDPVGWAARVLLDDAF